MGSESVVEARPGLPNMNGDVLQQCQGAFLRPTEATHCFVHLRKTSGAARRALLDFIQVKCNLLAALDAFGRPIETSEHLDNNHIISPESYGPNQQVSVSIRGSDNQLVICF